MTHDEVLHIAGREWRRLGVRRSVRMEMLDELRGNLAAASEDGRNPADVVGQDVRGFAGEWATARGVANGRPRATLLILAVFSVQSLTSLAHVATELNDPHVGGAGTALTFLVAQLAVYAVLGVGLWFRRRWAFFATAVVLTAEASMAVLVSVSNHRDTAEWMVFAVLALVALIALIHARGRTLGGRVV